MSAPPPSGPPSLPPEPSDPPVQSGPGPYGHYDHEGHTMMVWFDKVGNAQCRFTTILSW